MNIGEDFCSSFDIAPNDRLHCSLLCVREHFGANLAALLFAMPLKQTHNRRFADGPTTLRLPLADVHVVGLPTDVRFVNFCAATASAHLFKRAGLHSEA